MSIVGPTTNLIINAVTYPFPLPNAQDWGLAVTQWATAVSNGLLQKSGGTFTLTADVNFGANFGLLSEYFSSRSANPSQSGVFRLANAEQITWRNSNNTFDHYLSVNNVDELVFDGVPVGSGGSGGGSPLVFEFTGDGTTTVFSIPGIEASTANAYFVFLDGVSQTPFDDFIINLGAETITFTTAPFDTALILVRTYVGLGDSVEEFREELEDGTSGTSVANTLVFTAQTALELAAAVTPTVYFQKPYDVYRYGAVNDNATNSAPAAQSASTIASHYTLLDNGARLVYTPTNTSPYYFGNATGNLVYSGVLLTGSDYMIDGTGAVIRQVNRAGVAASDINYNYVTNKNLTVGAQTNITFNGISFDTNQVNVTNTNNRGTYMVGVDGLRYLNTRGFSSGTRRGNGLGNIQNSKNVQILGHLSKDTTQGCTFRYTENVCVVGGVWYNFSECLDFDGTQKRSVVVGNTFESTARTNQMIDVNGQVEGVFTGMTAFTLGNIATIQYKDTTPPNFSDYVNNVPPSSLTPSQRIIFGDVAGSAIGSTVLPSFIIGNDWSGIPHDGYLPVHEITLKNIALEDTSWIGIAEGINLNLTNIYLGGVLTAASNYAINATSQLGTSAQREWSNLTGTFRDIIINGAQRGGLRNQNAEWSCIDNVKVFNINTSGSTDFAVQLSGLHQRGAQITVDNIHVTSGNVNINGDTAAISAWVADTDYVKTQVVSNGGLYYKCITSGTSASSGGPTGTTADITDGTAHWTYLSEPMKILWGNRNILEAGSSLVFTGDVHKYTHGRTVSSQIGDLAATGTVSRPLYTASRKCYVPRALVTVATTIAGDPTNLRNFAFKSLTAALGTTTISSFTTAAGLTAYVQKDGGFAANEVGAYLEPGDTLYVDISSSAAGQAMVGVMIQLEILDC